MREEKAFNTELAEVTEKNGENKRENREPATTASQS
jgi:hypothetical protein